MGSDMARPQLGIPSAVGLEAQRQSIQLGRYEKADGIGAVAKGDQQALAQ